MDVRNTLDGRVTVSSQAKHPFDGLPVLPDELIFAVFQVVTMGPAAFAGLRCG